MGSNIEKEKLEFEKEIDDIQKKKLEEKKMEQEEILKTSKREFRQMNIIIYSKNKIPDEFISCLCDIKNLEDKDLYGVNIKIGKNPEKKDYLYKFVENGNAEKLEAISKDICREGILEKNSVLIDNVIVTISDDLKSNEIDELLNRFSKIPLKYQPFYLLLTLSEKEPNIEIIYNKISNFKKMDKRNFYTMRYEFSNDEVYYNLINQLNKFFSYFNELGDINIMEDKNNDFAARLNILVCGRAGAGKSTLINKILDEKRCREGSGLSVTKYMSYYNHKKYPLTIYDTPGFENKETINNVIDVIKKKIKNVKKQNNKYI
jgi:ABC-type multidrug transport system fused ATPase/permease subunit